MEARAKVGAKIAVWEQIAANSVSWDSTSLACITEEAAAPASTSVQENVGSGDKDPLTGTGLGTISFCGYTSGTRHYAAEAGTTGIATISFTGGDHITSGTPCAGTVSAQECDMIAIRTCLDSSKKDEARSVAPCTSGTFRFKPKKSLLGRPRRVLRERNDDSTGSDESIEVVDSQQNWSDSAGPSSGDSYKSDASKKENPLTNENLHVEVHKHSAVTKGVESGCDNILSSESTESERNRKLEVLSEGPVQEFTREQISVSAPQSENNGKGTSTRITDYRAINLKPLDGLAELKEELQVLQMLSKQRKVSDSARPTFRTDSQPTPGAVINPVDVHEKSAVDRPSSKILKSIEEQNVREKETLPTEAGVSGREKISPKEHVSSADLGNRPLIKDNGAFNVLVNPLLYPTAKCINSQEPCQQKGGNPVKSQPKAVEAKPQSPRPKALPESLTKGLPEEEASRNKVDTVSRKSRENGHFVWVNNRRYQKLGKIGSGGSSDVFKVIAQDCTIYALKRIFLKGRDHQTACGFHQEIAYLERLRGKRHIIQLIDYEVTDKNIFQNNFAFHGEIQNDACIYMVLEYGEIDLARMLERKKKEATEDGQLDENWLRLYWEHILKAVNTIHEERIVHADLKPANFLLVQGVLKLIDFGIAKAIQNDTTNIVREAQVGTLNYMSPEAFMMNSRDEHGTVKCGRASDIWSLGCILYQMVYGRTPFSHLNFYHKITEITNPKHEIEFPPIPNPLVMDIMRSCLVWDKRKRPRIPQLLEHPFLRPKVAELAINQQCLREVLLQSCKVYISVKGTLELTELMRKVVKGNSESSSEHQLDEALLQLSRLYMQKAGKPALHELLTTLL